MRLEITPVSSINESCLFTKKGRAAGKFGNHKTRHDTQKKPLVKPETTPTHTHTQLQTYQISKKGKADQSKHTPEKRNKNTHKNKSD